MHTTKPFCQFRSHTATFSVLPDQAPQILRVRQPLLPHASIQQTPRRSNVLLANGSIAAWIAGSVAAGVAAAAAAASGLFSSPQALVREGMEKFRKNDVEGSLQDFDKALELNPRLSPYMWQRGLSLYYLAQYQQGAKQFRDDVAVNPNDTEESIWAFLCEVQFEGTETARQHMLQVTWLSTI
eukprot:GHRR01023700.1.p2 GENE.GHRR01023700.1~~GHRR01023700.1.p2  ORF type:complete len:183 (+),score=63.61 GHRR01023700.1:1193-1741(+)